MKDEHGSGWTVMLLDNPHILKRVGWTKDGTSFYLISFGFQWEGDLHSIEVFLMETRRNVRVIRIAKDEHNCAKVSLV